MIMLGIFCTNLINLVAIKIDGQLAWQLSSVIILVVAIMNFWVLRGTDDMMEEFDALLEVNRVLLERGEKWRIILKKKYRPHFVMALVIPLFQQLKGINVIILYIGVVGGVLMSICQIAAALMIGTNPGEDIWKFYTYILLALLYIYSVGFACSWGLVGCLVPSEIFPLEIRSAGNAIMIAISLCFTFIMAQFFLGMFCKLGFCIFYLFATFVVTMTIFVIFFLPETKDIPITEMPTVWNKHWFWKRYVHELEEGRRECV
ncbi:hypothetical protein AQUCO_00600325v1 [Aquilegia coerulea]|uniref:Major facilitator superfamily (MFS) profile domain-containing protein n=1 Tax=Aquilegia coerulea TaxID=218851 RepID=A0A2G5EP60_AQUCA|nr:hypothetical protein AQUCO_00600325v1 [Aquilegia coerulea]